MPRRARRSPTRRRRDRPRHRSFAARRRSPGGRTRSATAREDRGAPPRKPPAPPPPPPPAKAPLRLPRGLGAVVEPSTLPKVGGGLDLSASLRLDRLRLGIHGALWLRQHPVFDEGTGGRRVVRHGPGRCVRRLPHPRAIVRVRTGRRPRGRLRAGGGLRHSRSPHVVDLLAHGRARGTRRGGAHPAVLGIFVRADLVFPDRPSHLHPWHLGLRRSAPRARLPGPPVSRSGPRFPCPELQIRPCATFRDDSGSCRKCTGRWSPRGTVSSAPRGRE